MSTRRRALAALAAGVIAVGAVGSARAQGFDFDALDLGGDEEEGSEAQPAPSPEPEEPPPPPPPKRTQPPPPKAQEEDDAALDFSGLDIGGSPPPGQAAPPPPARGSSHGTQPPPAQGTQPPPWEPRPAPGRPPQQQTAPPTTTPPEPLRERDTFELPGSSMSTPSAGRTRFDQAVAADKNKEYEQAAVAFFAILNDPAMKGFHAQAQYMLARSLYKLDLPHLSLHFLNRILEQGTGHKFFKASLGWLVFIADKVADTAVVLDTIARFPNISFPRRYADEFNYLLAKYFYLQEDPGRARQLGELVQADSEFYGRARYLLGVLDYQAERYQEAVDNFKIVIERMARKVADDDEDEDWRLLEMAYMTMARLHYEAQRFPHALYYYGKVGKDSGQWLTSMLESAWAEFRQGNDEKALGNLLTVHAPFFRDEYHPESMILEAVIYFENCRYPEAQRILQEFLNHYPPVLEELKRVTSQDWTPGQYYQLISDLQAQRAGGVQSPLLRRILSLALSDKTLSRQNHTIREIEAEVARLQTLKDFFRVSPLARAAADILQSSRQLLVNQAGALAKEKLLRERDNLNGLIGQTYRIQFETATAEKESLEMSLREDTGRVQLRAYAYSTAVADDQVYWPFEGEYWSDELGSYEYTLTKGCK